MLVLKGVLFLLFEAVILTGIILSIQTANIPYIILFVFIELVVLEVRNYEGDKNEGSN